MTIDNFLTEMQNYYNYKYNKTQKKYIEKWLKDRKNKTLPYILLETMKLFNPTSTKPIPGVYDLEEGYRIVRRERAREIYQPALPEPDEGVDQEPTKEQVEQAAQNLTRIGLERIAHRLREKHLHEN